MSQIKLRKVLLASAVVLCAIPGVELATTDAVGDGYLVSAADARFVWSPMNARHLRVRRPRMIGRRPATWYGPGFWGHRTGCGRTLRRRTWGVAHRTLPCGKLVWLRYRGRSVAVPVVDRGPYSGADVDLTKRTSDFLRFTRAGTGQVRIAVLRRRIPLRRL